MGNRDKRWMTGITFLTLFERFEKHRTVYIALAVSGYILVNNTINASSDWMETIRDGSPEFAMWEPFLWEYSSALGSLLILPIVFFIWQRVPLKLFNIPKQIGIHLLVSLLFSAVHVCVMVWSRELIYWLAGSQYDFGPIFREFFYEYRKDLWGYLFFLTAFHLYQIFYSRLKGEANLIAAESNQPAKLEIPEHFIVKKLDREFLVKVDDIEWMESAGNYVNLYCGGRIYPLRSTLSVLTERLESRGFSRIHRSFAVNHNSIEHIHYLPSGDGEIQLKNGKKLNLSRRYKDAFKQRLS